MNDDELVEILEDAGLSPYQAEAYVTLLGQGTAPAQDVATASDVPEPRIYDVLRNLAERGYVETFEQDAKMARAAEPDVVGEELRTRAEQYVDAAEAIETRWNRPPIADHDVTLFQRVDTVVDRAGSLIDDATIGVEIATDPAGLDQLAPAIERASERGVVVNVVLCTDTEPRNLADLGEHVTELRRRPGPAPLVVLVDNRWTCFAPAARPDEYGLIVDDRRFAFVVHWYFKAGLWDGAERIAGSESPTVYLDVDRCAEDVARLLDDGATVEVRIRGEDRTSGVPVTYEGVVRSVDPAGPPGDESGGSRSIVVDTGDGTLDVGGWDSDLDRLEITGITVTDVTDATDPSEE